MSLVVFKWTSFLCLWISAIFHCLRSLCFSNEWDMMVLFAETFFIDHYSDKISCVHSISLKLSRFFFWWCDSSVVECEFLALEVAVLTPCFIITDAEVIHKWCLLLVLGNEREALAPSLQSLYWWIQSGMSCLESWILIVKTCFTSDSEEKMYRLNFLFYLLIS